MRCVTAGRRPVRFALAAGAVLAASGLTQGMSGRLLHIERDFFGVVRVTEDPDRTVHRLFHGSTLHGQQSLDPSRPASPRPTSPDPARSASSSRRSGRGSSGPGRGSRSSGWVRARSPPMPGPGQRWTFYEIDPAIERIARDPRYFTYLRDCRAGSLEVVLGDARLRLAECARSCLSASSCSMRSAPTRCRSTWSRGKRSGSIDPSWPKGAYWRSTCRTDTSIWTR